MKQKDTFDVITSMWAVITDAIAIYAGFMLATWIRFDSGWIPVRFGEPVNLYEIYCKGALVATVLCLIVFKILGLFVRPQMGSFANKIPRLVRATGIGILATIVLAFAVRNRIFDYSSGVLIISFMTVALLLVILRYIMFRVEWNASRHSRDTNQILIIGTDSVAAHLQRTLKKEVMLRAKVAGFLRTNASEPDKEIQPEQIKGKIEDIEALIDKHPVDQIILTDSGLGHKRIVDLIMLCDRNLITFNMVPDLFRIITSSMDMQSLNDIPLLGMSKWPLDLFWNRTLKRAEDVAGAIVGLIIATPVIGIASIFIKSSSPGPAFYRQERCGENGKVFNLYKLRTMPVDAEKESGPVWTVENDPRRTKIGTFLRQYNLDELPQLWNVLTGEMSLVGPRPERPHFVEKFKEDVGRYMWRHVSKPGMTGWAQVNGLRGNTSIEERIKYDLYYLENWSLALDFKIILRTVFARENAY
ncbi:MAG: undecaprenyl-phosphate glucose phosphotransferase [Lentisphaerae bacterium RIFOXYA12_FULL_48_11]|nr:MAG: undecaprenyl-phosphate glucose phosphotransferase [Lentisphaerae bacterium RIFOXYA12_FULL_48_11]